ncbi:hypothetical protein CPAR01_10516 [Colletotrichum paranaense]|uniref:Secreted protein n=2 Tax=Colletotrichum acutatum species complex TaxID=2707335 RepID=A0ABQ9QEX4_9PEZI|nr:uncharacterized protein CPAR01_10516 [Colletotrichum paranaense]KAK0382382.1 hypothetical protein CLIM01_00195 [Colletotrichum limetticola]KAK1533808.1 hypothetical protein CPAR01_10516 [Colletotrichum paranaense]
MCCGHCPSWRGWAAVDLVCSLLPLKSSHQRGMCVHTYTRTHVPSKCSFPPHTTCLVVASSR